MGFFSDILGAALPIVGAVLGGPAGAAAGVALAGIVDPEDEPAPLTIGGTGVRAITLEEAKAAQKAGVLGPAATGGLRKRTIVETVNNRGIVVKRKVTKGGVAVFQADVTAANRVARQLRKLDKRMPRKLVKQSEISRLKDEVTEAALRHARDHGEHHLLPGPPRC